MKDALCVNQEVGNVALDLRCQGFKQGLGRRQDEGAGGRRWTRPTVKSAVDGGVADRTRTLDGILTLGPVAADPSLDALESSNKIGKIEARHLRPVA